MGIYTDNMHPPAKESSSTASQLLNQPNDEQSASSSVSLPAGHRNFVVMVFYQVIMRTGWIFKTESVIMPAVVDSISGAGWMRGCLPLFNRFGQSVPPLLLARRIKIAPRKKWVLTAATSLMALSFLTLSAIWLATPEPKPSWMPAAFLFFYALFFISTGVNQIAFGTVQGKLIRVNRRGRLLLMASMFGGFCSIVAALTLMPLWIRNDGASQFGLVFGFAGICFAGSAVASLFLKEEKDNYRQPEQSFFDPFVAAVATVRSDKNLRRLVLVGALFGTSMMLFPHYQALGRIKLGLAPSNLIWYVVIQNLGTALFSLPVGWLADRCGNRLVLRLIFLAVCMAPVSALLLAYYSAVGGKFYYLVFLLVGLTPVAIRTLNNYTLEISKPADHPRYLSTLGLCVAAPVFLSPLAGRLVDAFDFFWVFSVINVLVFLGWLLTFRLAEPRHYPIDITETATPAGE